METPVRQLITLFLILISLTANGQVEKGTDLFKEFKQLDSTFFERGFNQCDMEYLKNHITRDLKFYHDQSGLQDERPLLRTRKNTFAPIGKENRSAK